MKRSLVLPLVLLLTTCLIAPAMGGTQEKQAPSKPANQVEQLGNDTTESDGKKLHREYFQKREKAKKHRDQMLKEREKALKSQE